MSKQNIRKLQQLQAEAEKQIEDELQLYGAEQLPCLESARDINPMKNEGSSQKKENGLRKQKKEVSH